ncbi:MAG: threonylcarbamoyl-AMP synthase [Saprospirales bacterium]|nr:MAG: threonylcarbamoyl-AMP synthase [Saprospirales bacterium]
MGKLLKIHPENPEGRKISEVCKTLEGGGMVIYPTDSVYAIGCDILRQDVVERIFQFKGLDPTLANMTFLCKDISQIAEYAAQINNDVFKILKRNTPGPFTFIIKANSQVPRIFKNRRRTIGVRIPKNKIVLDIIEGLGRPLLSTSLKRNDDELEYYTEPSFIYERYGSQFDTIIDGGIGQTEPSTIVDCTEEIPEIIREGFEELR